MTSASLAGNPFFGCKIGATKAPSKKIREFQSKSSYYATVFKRFGFRISVSDFLKIARRFLTICNEIQRGSSIELLANTYSPVVVLRNDNNSGGNSGELIDVSKLTDNEFKRIFKQSSSMTLEIRPKDSNNMEMKFSYGLIEWTSKKPDVIFVYAKGFSEELAGTLNQKLFFVPESAPNMTLSVKLGRRAFNMERIAM